MGSDETTKYAVLFDLRAKRQFDKLNQGQRKALHDALILLENNPNPPCSKELEKYEPLRRIKAKDVRAIYTAFT